MAVLRTFERLGDTFDGEALAPIGHIDRKEEGYFCTACNMELVVDVYNRLRTRDEVVTCPGCGRLLYIPDDLTPEVAVRQKKTVKKAVRKKSTKKTIKRSRKGMPTDLKRMITTAAAASLRQAELDDVQAVEVEVRVEKVEQPMTSLRVRDAEDLSRRMGAMMQAEDAEYVYEVVPLVTEEDEAAAASVPEEVLEEVEAAVAESEVADVAAEEPAEAPASI